MSTSADAANTPPLDIAVAVENYAYAEYRKLHFVWLHNGRDRKIQNDREVARRAWHIAQSQREKLEQQAAEATRA